MVPDTIPDDRDAQEQEMARRAWVRLHAFKRDLLVAIAAFEDEPKGLEIKQYLGSEYGEEINHGRMYPNLDDLDDAGLIDKRPGEDDRSNEYALTEWGERVLAAGRDRLTEVTPPRRAVDE
jgi:DNA-binding PadR family transcriptional regulator